MSNILVALVSLTLLSLPAMIAAAPFGTAVPLMDRGAATYYVSGRLGEEAAGDFMVDTGSGYVTVNERTLAALKQAGHAVYVKDLTGVLADGSETRVPVYRVASLNIGCCCMVKDVDVAVFPGARRQILGLSALKKVAPFAVSVEPPSLMLTNCGGTAATAGAAFAGQALSAR